MVDCNCTAGRRRLECKEATNVLQPLLPGCQQAERGFGEAAAACNQHRGGQRSNVHICVHVKKKKSSKRKKEKKEKIEPFTRSQVQREKNKDHHGSLSLPQF